MERPQDEDLKNLIDRLNRSPILPLIKGALAKVKYKLPLFKFRWKKVERYVKLELNKKQLSKELTKEQENRYLKLIGQTLLYLFCDQNQIVKAHWLIKRIGLNFTDTGYYRLSPLPTQSPLQLLCGKNDKKSLLGLVPQTKLDVDEPATHYAKGIIFYKGTAIDDIQALRSFMKSSQIYNKSFKYMGLILSKEGFDTS